MEAHVDSERPFQLNWVVRKKADSAWAACKQHLEDDDIAVHVQKLHPRT
jgi:hypothetical protein